MKTKLLKKLRKRAKKEYWVEIRPHSNPHVYDLMAHPTHIRITSADNLDDITKYVYIYRRNWILEKIDDMKDEEGRYKLDI